jgi:cytochrome o ubiquinol oxidase subunit 3
MVEEHTHHHPDTYSKTIFGFWLYLMTDCLLFGSFFATYAVLQDNTFGGPTARDLFNLPLVLTQTLILLASSFACGPAQVAELRQDKKKVLLWLGVAFVLGAVFFGMVFGDLIRLVQEGNGWQKSAFLSAFFTLVGVQLMHIVAGLLWMLILMGLVVKRGLIESTIRRLTCLRLFWHFLNIVWIFIFTFVYLMGVK